MSQSTPPGCAHSPVPPHDAAAATNSPLKRKSTTDEVGKKSPATCMRALVLNTPRTLPRDADDSASEQLAERERHEWRASSTMQECIFDLDDDDLPFMPAHHTVSLSLSRRSPDDSRRCTSPDEASAPSAVSTPTPPDAGVQRHAILAGSARARGSAIQSVPLRASPAQGPSSSLNASLVARYLLEEGDDALLGRSRC